MTSGRTGLTAAALLAALALSACGHVAIDLNATPAQVEAAKKAQQQAEFNQACGFLKNAAAAAKPLVPLISAKLGNDGTLVVNAALDAIKTTCAGDLDINNADSIRQKLYDLGGEVLATVVKAKTGT